MVGLFCTYRYQFLYGNKRKISEYCQSQLILLNAREATTYTFYCHFCVYPNNFKVKIPMSENYCDSEKTIADTIGIATFLSMQ